MKKLMVLIISVVMCAGVGGRIYYVNSSAPQEKYEYYAMNEWVEYEGAFQGSITENTNGYSAKVLSAEYMTYEDYLVKHQLSLEDFAENEKPSSMIDVEMEFRNISSVDGVIALTELIAFASGDNTYYSVDSSILTEQNPELVGEMGMGFSLYPTGKVTTLHLPFALPVRSNGYRDQETGQIPKYLALTRTPVKKMIALGDK